MFKERWTKANYVRLNYWCQFFASPQECYRPASLPRYHGGWSMPLPVDAGLGHVTCFGQWKVSRHGASRGLKPACAGGRAHACSCLLPGEHNTLGSFWLKEEERHVEQV